MKTNFKKYVLLSAFAFLASVACKQDAKEEIAVVEKIPGINVGYMDTNIKPSEDFFKHVNGKWLDNNEIPDDRTRWGSFDELRQKTDEDALAILKSAMSDNKDLSGIEVLPGSDKRKPFFFFKQ